MRGKMLYPNIGVAVLRLSFKPIPFIALALALVFTIACSRDAAPGDCIDAAKDAGVPDKVVEWMRSPSQDWGAIERIAIREALEKFGIGDFCADVQESLTLAESSAIDEVLETAKDTVGALTPSPRPPVPTLRPTPRMPATPLPAPTTAPVPEPTLAPSDTARITHISFSGAAGKPGSRFIVHFSRPVFIELPPGFDRDYDDYPVRLVTGHPDNYDDRLYYYSTNDISVSGIAIRSNRPTDNLSFGPVEREFVVAYYLVGADYLRNPDGTQAFNQSIVQIPGDTVFLNPDNSADANDPALVSCVAFMEFAGIPSPVARSVKSLSTDSLTDSERGEWRRFLLDGEYIRYSDSIWDKPDRLDVFWKKEPCAALWSESVNERNAVKRNRDWEEECLQNKNKFFHEDIHELANRAYTDLEVADRLVLQLIMDDSNCRVFYPQLYFGQWIPTDRDSKK